MISFLHVLKFYLLLIYKEEEERRLYTGNDRLTFPDVLLYSKRWGRLFIVFTAIPLFSQQVNFENVSVTEGLSQSQVYSIVQDSTGFIWMGTRGGGLSRFDGREFYNYSTQNGLASNFIRTLAIDPSGAIWIGTDNGLSIFKKEKFVSYNEETGLFNSTVTAILPLPNGETLLGTEDGLFIFQKDTIVRFGRKADLPQGLIKCLFRDSRSDIWVGTEFGLLKISYKAGNISYSAFTVNNGLSNNIINDIDEDRAGYIYAATYGGGISILTNNGQVHSLKQPQGLPTNTVHTILITNTNELWTGTGSGIARFVLSGEKPQLKLPVYTEAEGLANNLVHEIFEDRAGIIWMGTGGGGVSKLGSERFLHFSAIDGIMGPWVFAILEDIDGSMWFSTSEGGVTRYQKGVFKRFSQKDGATAHSVRALFKDRKGRIWLGTVGDGLYIYDHKRFTHHTIESGLPSRFISSITQDTSGAIWLGTAGNGIIRMTEDLNQVNVLKVKNGLPNNRINQVVADSSGNIWAATINGLARIIFHENSWKVLRYPQLKGNIRSVALCKEGVFIGTAEKGAAFLNDSKIRWYSRHLSSLNCYSLLWDQASLWIGTEKGLDRLYLDGNYSVSNTRFYGSAQGFRGIETILNASLLDSKNNCWFGTIKGACCYQPALDHTVTSTPTLLLTGIQLFFDRLQSTPYAGKASLPFGLPAELNLPYDKNHLSFQFAGIEHAYPKGLRYRWKLKGLDNEWSPYSSRQEAVYANIPPGNYTFQVQAISESGVFSNVLSYPVSIRTPFWATWWFRFALILSGFGMIFGVVRWRWHQREQKNKEERRKLEMERNLLELEQRSLRLQMNPHFLFNCLNSIKGLIAENDLDGAKNYLTRFARLMRNLLELSRKEQITLKEELQTLQWYVDLEKISSSKQYEFVIQSESVDPESVTVPPMLLQPFVENAIWHGISGKIKDGKIEVKVQREHQQLVLSVTDNGVGREEAGRLAQQQEIGHKSTAITIAAERLHLLDQKLGVKSSSIQMIDLKENGTPSGTRIVIRIPYQLYN